MLCYCLQGSWRWKDIEEQYNAKIMELWNILPMQQCHMGGIKNRSCQKGVRP